MSAVKPKPVAPDSVHVWRGFRSQAKTQAEFAKFLGTVFVPACALLQPNAGLHAYLPSMPAQEGKPAGVPDQTALMFWTTPQTYHDGFKKLAVRAYTNLHGDAYDTSISSAQFPVPLADAVKSEQPYYLINKPADWMLGTVQHLIGGRPEGQAADAFFAGIRQWAAALQADPPSGLDGGLLCAGESYVVAWLLWDPAAVSSDPIQALGKLTTPCLDSTAASEVLPAGLWDDWPGLDLTKPTCLNIQLDRPGEGG